jgi:hypothetical protein
VGPEALDISREEFEARLKPFRDDIKGVLTRSEFVAGLADRVPYARPPPGFVD